MVLVGHLRIFNQVIYWLLARQQVVEAIATIEVIRNNYVPMTAGTTEVSDYTPNVIYGQEISFMLFQILLIWWA